MSRSETLSLTSEALFRYRIICNVLTLEAQGHGRDEAVRLVAEKEHLDHGEKARSVSDRTIYRWLQAYRDHALAGLEHKARASSHISAVPPAFLDFVASQKEADPRTSLPEIIRRARMEGVLRPDQGVDRSTLWRECKRRGIITQRKAKERLADMRRFAYSERLQMVLADFKHFRAGPKRVKRVALYLLDDATRYGIDVFVGTSEAAEVLLLALNRVVRKVGLMDALYWDRGSAFIDHDVARVAASLGIAIIFGKPAYPQGHGKVERFNGSVDERLLRTLGGTAQIHPGCSDLTLRLRHDLHEIYNHLPHESLDGDTPYQRWMASQRLLRPAPSEEHLINAFAIPLTRWVSPDQVISYKSVDYEMPRGYAREKVTLWRRLLENDALYFQHEGQFIRLHPVNLAFNATRPRAKALPKSETPTGALPKSSSTLHFENTFSSMVNPDGGYDQDPHKESI